MNNQSDENAPDKDEWISAVETLKRATSALGRSQTPLTIAKRAYVGLIRTRAVRFIKGEEEYRNVDLPIEFWWAKGHAALTQDWVSGDFDIWIDKGCHWQAYGVEFNRKDVEKMLEGVEILEPAPVKSKQIKGRGRSEDWKIWFAEMAAYIYGTKGFNPSAPGAQARLIKGTLDGLASRNKSYPSPELLKPYAREIIERLKKDI